MTRDLSNPLQSLIAGAAKALPQATGQTERFKARMNGGGQGVVILADVSGSMSESAGSKRKIAVLQDALESLWPDLPDARLIAFSSIAATLASPADLPTPNGGTALHLGLDAARAIQPAKTVVISDGRPDSEDAALASAECLGGVIDVIYCGPDSDHEAIAAFEPDTGALLGIARYVRSREDPQAAEVAVTVADDWQRRGLGRALLDRLTYRARREGIRRFSALVLGENRPALGLFGDLGEASRLSSASEVELLIDLPAERGMGAQLGRALRAAGAGSLIPARTLAQRVAVSVGSAAAPARSMEPIRTIVVGVDGGPSGVRALRVAGELAAALAGVLHVVSAFTGARGRATAERAPEQAERDSTIDVLTHALRGDPGDALIAVAEEARADLIVVGDGSTSRGKRFLAGSVTNRVSHHAPCSVLIVRASPSEAGNSS